MTASSVQHTERKGMARLLTATVAGTTVEFYDFFLYASATALVFNKLFFPADDPLTGVLMAFSVYAVGFLSRPVGALVFGHVGDKYGRRAALVSTLSLMGVATFAIGLIPSYDAIGALAPILLTVIRLLQGLAVGGEWGGAVLLVAEHVSPSRRGLWTAMPQIGGPLGNLLSSAVLGILGLALDPDAFLAWGWRIAFFLSAVVVFVGVYARRKVDESPLFLEAQAAAGARRHARAPLAEVLRHHKRSVLISTVLRIGENTAYYLLTTFLIVYVTTVLSADKSIALNAIMVASVVQAVTFVLGGVLSDRFGRKAVIITGACGLAGWIFAYYPMVSSLNTVSVLVAVSVAVGLQGIMVGASSALFSEIFSTRVRFTGASLGYQFGSVLGGAIAPLIATSLLQRFDSWVPVSIYIATVSLLAGAVVLLTKETRGRDLRLVGSERDAASTGAGTVSQSTGHREEIR